MYRFWKDAYKALCQERNLMKETRQIPVQKGKTYELSIQGLGTSGEGIGRYEGFTVFVPYALPGETVRAG